MEDYLPLIWAGILSLAVTLYVIMDGFDLGIGILYPTTKDEGERDQMMNAVAPFWDGNETWLVLGGAGLLVAFPIAYAIIMPAVYIPILVMLLGLILRGVAFEFRWVAKPNHRLWDAAFFTGSTAAAFSQGLVLGAFLQGFDVDETAFSGGPFDWLSPFALTCGLGLVAGYALLGATFLILRTGGRVQEHMRRLARPLLLVVLAFIGLVSIWTPLGFERIAERWFTLRNLLFLWPIPLATAALALLVWRSIDRERDYLPFLGSIGIFLLCFVGLGVSMFPFVIPPDITIWEAAAAPESQAFMLVGTAVMLPVILGYTVFVYWTFRGKIGPGEGYH